MSKQHIFIFKIVKYSLIGKILNAMFLKRNCITFVITCLVCLTMNGQNTFKIIEGRIKSETMDVSDLHVINTTSKKATITNPYGYFSISVKLNDTIWFSAIQYKKSHLVVTNEILESEMVTVTLDEALTELEEVVITPYMLSGDIEKDIQSLKIEPVVTASTLELPNAYVKTLTQNERRLWLAMDEQLLHKLIDEMTGHNTRLRNWVSRDQITYKVQTVKEFYPDSIYSQELKIPSERIYDFIHFCAVDSIFNSTIYSQDKLKIWEFLEKRSEIYRKNNDLD